MASSKGISWLNYDGTNGAFLPDSLFFNWTAANAQSNVVPIENFFQDAYLGLLPQLSYLNPSCCGLDTNSMHPSGNVSFGQAFIKQIYDAVRTGPQWENTLILITYDETGKTSLIYPLFFYGFLFCLLFIFVKKETRPKKKIKIK